jgi:hypothetical protein
MHDALLARVLTIDKDIKIRETRAVKNRNKPIYIKLKSAKQTKARVK